MPRKSTTTKSKTSDKEAKTKTAKKSKTTQSKSTKTSAKESASKTKTSTKKTTTKKQSKPKKDSVILEEKPESCSITNKGEKPKKRKKKIEGPVIPSAGERLQKKIEEQNSKKTRNEQKGNTGIIAICVNTDEESFVEPAPAKIKKKYGEDVEYIEVIVDTIALFHKTKIHINAIPNHQRYKYYLIDDELFSISFSR